MSSRTLFVFVIFLSLADWACAEPQVESAAPASGATGAVPVIAETVTEDPADLLPNGRMPAAGVLVGGQPTAEQFRALARLGYGTVVNLRTPGEPGNTDPQLLESLAMDYITLPISGPDSLSEENARELAEILAAADSPVVVHCASGNRVGALFALKAFYADGESPEASLALGQRAGMTRLEPVIRQKLEIE